MKEILTTITKKGQVTIPVEIRRLLGFKAKDKVAFRIDGDNVRLAPAKYNLETVYGVVKPLNKPEDFKKLKQTAIKEHVKKVMEEMEK
ncbi:MAG: AbrB/MazE/SpoVT family DNA-binding domain-containing protein [Actinobacteria bacterium]|nr:AbrB/MazE/SpoVT family DNA-binding domain-containing protein [Cyanobacteriota bacterium]MCL5771056.1 AbrB/MazE/SpoVT family DNA-binding domain-containing protein [Actinomycetota bacterium]